MTTYHVLNLGAGVQSTTLYMLDATLPFGGKLHFDAAIFADTKSEPQAVYDHLDWLRSLGGPRIIIQSKGDLEHDLIAGQNGDHNRRSGSARFTSIPAFTAEDHRLREGEAEEGRIQRQCTKEYKVEVIERTIRRILLGLAPRKRVPRDVAVHQYFGFTVDEARRAVKVRERLNEKRWARPEFPFLDMGWSRRGCIEWLKDKVPHEVPRSACVFCPCRTDHEWKKLKDDSPEEFARAVAMDEAIRDPSSVVTRGLDRSIYLHRTCVPLAMVDFDNLPPQTLDPFTLYDCTGLCGV